MAELRKAGTPLLCGGRTVPGATGPSAHPQPRLARLPSALSSLTCCEKVPGGARLDGKAGSV